MNLADLRRLAIRRQVKIRFFLQNGMECVITEHGVAQAPGLRGAPPFNFENELASAQEFRLESAAAANDSSGPHAVPRAELEAMLAPSPGNAPAGEDA